MDRRQLWGIRFVAGVGVIIGFFVAAVLPGLLGIDHTIWPKVLLTLPGTVLSTVCVVLIVSSMKWMIQWRRKNVDRWHEVNDPQ